MNLSTILIVSLALSIICNKYSDAAVGKAFSMIDPVGNSGDSCATEVPSKEELASDFIQCGVLCTAEPACIYFSYTEETQRCLTFNSSPTTFATVDTCNTYIVLISEISPKDVLAYVGSLITLECRRSSQLVQWTHLSNASSKLIVERCQVVDEFADLYAVDKSDLSCNLIINNVTLGQGGLYTCQDQLSTETPSTAEVLVLSLSCNTSVSNGTILNGASLQLTCTVNYVGSLVPSTEWKDFMNRVLLNATTQVTATYVTSNISIPAFLPAVKWFTFVTYMPIAPHLTYTWTSDNITVLCPESFKPSSGSNTCYRTIFNAGNWMTSGQKCDALFNGSYSAVITSHAESIAIITYLAQQIADNATAWSSVTNKLFWTSGQRLTNCSSPFVWKPKPNSMIPFAYLNWATNEPNCLSSAELCVHVSPVRNFSQADYDGAVTDCVLCEYGPF